MARQMKDSGIEWIGEIPEGWEVIKAKYCAQVSHGSDPQTEGNIPVYGSGAESFKTCGEYKEGPVVLVGRKGATLHIPHYIEGRYWNVDTAFDVRTNKMFLLRMYYYTALCFDYKYYMSQTTLPGMTQTNYNNTSLPRPSVPEQKKIVAFLDRRCAEIDAVIERTKVTIEEYKKLKQAVITEAVTKGVRGPRKMKDSGIEWIGEIPEEWEVAPLKYFITGYKAGPFGSSLITDKLNSSGNILVYTPEHVAKKTAELEFNLYLPDERQEEMQQFVVTPGDIIFPIVGSLGRSMLVTEDMPMGIINQRLAKFRLSANTLAIEYFLWLFSKSSFYNTYIDLNCRGSIIVNLTKQIVYDMPVPHPIDLNEQAEIIAYLDEKCTALDTLITKKTALLTELGTYKKSLIYEYVTGKKEYSDVVQQEERAVEYPFYPATVNTKKPRFAQAVLMAKVLDMHGKGIGRVKLEKMLYTIETSIGFDFDTEYVREAAGPLHESIYKCEGIIDSRNGWYQVQKSKYGISYAPTQDAGKYKSYYDKYFSSFNKEIERIIGIFKPYNTDQAEIVATLFAAWNDAMIAGKPYTDEDVVDDVLNNWHDSKKRYPKDMWLRAMAQMRKDGLVPKGYGKRTVMKKNS